MIAPDYQGRSQPVNKGDLIATAVVSMVLAAILLAVLLVSA